MQTKTLLYIKADTNDGDYIASENEICGNDLEVIRKVCGVINTVGNDLPYNWVTQDDRYQNPHEEYKDYLGWDEIYIFNKYVPRHEYGVHTIEEVELREVTLLEKFI